MKLNETLYFNTCIKVQSIKGKFIPFVSSYNKTNKNTRYSKVIFITQAEKKIEPTYLKLIHNLQIYVSLINYQYKNTNSGNGLEKNVKSLFYRSETFYFL